MYGSKSLPHCAVEFSLKLKKLVAIKWPRSWDKLHKNEKKRRKNTLDLYRAVNFICTEMHAVMNMAKNCQIHQVDFALKNLIKKFVKIINPLTFTQFRGISLICNFRPCILSGHKWSGYFTGSWHIFKKMEHINHSIQWYASVIRHIFDKSTKNTKVCA